LAARLLPWTRDATICLRRVAAFSDRLGLLAQQSGRAAEPDPEWEAALIRSGLRGGRADAAFARGPQPTGRRATATLFTNVVHAVNSALGPRANSA
jgi:hypothetical protein